MPNAAQHVATPAVPDERQTGKAMAKTNRPVRKSLRSKTKRSPSSSEIEDLPATPDETNIELVFGFVGPTGIDLNKVCDVLRSQLRSFGYDCEEIRLSDLISTYLGTSTSFENAYVRTKTLMARGTALR
ncbi:hypothetical protein [Roseateles sp.]|uniref:hypothetical protein n=1 Tax=Roseateles sp. TaxID=1971397 RepID=UPI0031DA0C20